MKSVTDFRKTVETGVDPHLAMLVQTRTEVFKILMLWIFAHIFLVF